MTEIEWLICSDPRRLLSFLKAKATVRKVQLFAVACCRGLGRWLPDQRSRKAVEAAERQADGLAGEHELQAARQEALAANASLIGKPTCLSETARAAWYALLDPEFGSVAAVAVSAVRFSVSEQVDGYRFSEEADPVEVRAATLQEESRQTDLLRDIFGNPFRPVTFDPNWLNADVLALARQMYETRDFSAIPILADALMDAGCGEEQVLGHCRGDGPHVRGCWVIDALTGRS